MELKEIAQKYRALHRADGSVTENEWDEISEPARQYWLKRTEQLIALFESAGYRRLPEGIPSLVTSVEPRIPPCVRDFDAVAYDHGFTQGTEAQRNYDMKWARGEK